MQSALIWVVGEALIDLLPGEIPIVGGGPANTAKALSNLGIKTSFVGGISADNYGKLIESELNSFDVDLRSVNRSALPTAVAKVLIDDAGFATYQFNLGETATFDFGEWLPQGTPKVLHIGSLATVVEPGATRLFGWARKLNSVIVYDPNVRSTVLPDRGKYRKYFEKWAHISTVVKLSEDDLEFLGISIEDVFKLGAQLVVLTHGERGISGFRSEEEVFVPGIKVDVVDTVGAGDTVGAVIVEGLVRYGGLKGEKLRLVLERAAKAAAITCTRAGACPPTLEELGA